jgi:hypothetical protein
MGSHHKLPPEGILSPNVSEEQPWRHVANPARILSLVLWPHGALSQQFGAVVDSSRAWHEEAHTLA